LTTETNVAFAKFINDSMSSPIYKRALDRNGIYEVNVFDFF